MIMEIKLKNRLLFILTAGLLINGCSGQEYTKKQLDSIYLERYRLYDNIKSSEIKINDLFTIDDDKKILKNLEKMYGKADAYEEYGPFQDEGIDEIGYDYTYGCTDFNDCKGKRKNGVPYNLISFSKYPNKENKQLSYISILLSQYNGQEFFISIKEKKITVGNTLEDIRELFPNSYKYYKILSDNNYPVGFQVMIFPENKKIYFEIDENNIIMGIEIDEIE
tara:strand:- start:49303 stop:49968 length:666 start_codon:yes stop_codon:yes gene_type:complete